MKLSARVFGFLIAFILIFSVSKTSFAQVTPTQTASQQSVNINTSNNLHLYTQNVLIEVMTAMGCQLVGIDPANRQQPCLEVNPLTGKIGFIKQNNHGLVGSLSNMISQLYTPPTQTSEYIRYLAGNFGIAKTASAQIAGIGLGSISPIANLWIAFRNIVYLFFVIIFVLIGVGIMLRIKIDPRTVMTIQNQIPKIVIGIILVTLSFPIAGFLIDLMWVLIVMIIGVFAGIEGSGITTEIFRNDPGSLVSPFGLANLSGGALGVAKDAAFGIGNSIFQSGFQSEKVNELLGITTRDCGFLGIGCWIDVLIGTILSVIVGFIAFLVITVAIILSLFRLWFALLKAYISILIDIITAPFWIAAGLIPGAGEKVSFGAWLRDMMGNLMAFPAVITIFLLAATFINVFKATDKVSSMFLPPLIGSPDPKNFGAIIAFGLIMFSPEVVKMTKAAFKAPQGMGGSIGKGMSVAGGIISMPVKRVGGALFGKNAYGVPNVGSQWVGNRFGRLAQFASGGGTKVQEGLTLNKKGEYKASLLRLRRPVGGRSQKQIDEEEAQKQRLAQAQAIADAKASNQPPGGTGGTTP